MADENELEGAVLPEGIEVDETSAYFGITDSSDPVSYTHLTLPTKA